MSKSSLIAARNSAYSKLNALVDAWTPSYEDWPEPEAIIAMADALDARIAALQTSVAFLRHEALRAIGARKGVAA
jgi:hypothetical protein